MTININEINDPILKKRYMLAIASKKLENERIRRYTYRTRQEAQIDVFDYIECFYNKRKLYSYLKYKSPSDFEAEGNILN
jgi:transposase InsO family protein